MMIIIYNFYVDNFSIYNFNLDSLNKKLYIYYVLRIIIHFHYSYMTYLSRVVSYYFKNKLSTYLIHVIYPYIIIITHNAFISADEIFYSQQIKKVKKKGAH